MSFGDEVNVLIRALPLSFPPCVRLKNEQAGGIVCSAWWPVLGLDIATPEQIKKKRSEEKGNRKNNDVCMPLLGYADLV